MFKTCCADSRHTVFLFLYDWCIFLVLFALLSSPAVFTYWIGACRESELRGNILFSPFNITTALAMTWVGARNDTARQIKEVLEFSIMGEDEAIIHQTFYEALSEMQCASGGPSSSTSTSTSGTSGANNNSSSSGQQKRCVLRSANRIFLDESLQVQDPFAAILAKKFLSDVGRVNFRGQSGERSRREINDWVAETTDNQIRELLPESTVGRHTRVALVNAIYFKGVWCSRFEQDKVHAGYFYRKKFERPVTVTMLENRAAYPFIIDYDFKCKVIEVPYSGGRFGMLIFLPFDVEGLASLERKFSSGLIKFLKKSMTKTKVTVVLPEMRMRNSVALGEVLAALGARDLFYHDRADLSGMTGGRDLYYMDMMHSVVLDANDGGRKATLGAAKSSTSSRQRSQELTFVADHPFLFLIYDKPSKLTLFLGRFMDPNMIVLDEADLEKPP